MRQRKARAIAVAAQAGRDRLLAVSSAGLLVVLSLVLLLSRGGG